MLHSYMYMAYEKDLITSLFNQYLTMNSGCEVAVLEGATVMVGVGVTVMMGVGVTVMVGVGVIMGGCRCYSFSRHRHLQYRFENMH